jgi:alpha-tubulin suppressor-like RCC1 family protein
MFLHFRSRKALLFLVLTTLATASDLAAAPIVPISVVSRKDHGSNIFDVFDVPLPLTGAPGVECRGDTGEHQLAIEFATPVTVTTVAVTTGVGYLVDWWVFGSTVHVFLTGVSNGQRLTVTLSMVRDGTGSVHDVIVPMIVLAGDTTASGNVDGNDSVEVENQIGQPLSVANSRMDVTLDGAIDETDVKFVDNRVGGNSVSLAFPRPDLLTSGNGSASVLLRSDGTLSSWGTIPGDGTPRARSYPSPLPALTNIISVSAGEAHAAALAANSVVWAWGENSDGQVGDDTNTLRRSPIPVMGNATSVKAGGYHTLALLPDGTVAAWGQNSYGQLGFGTTSNYPLPAVINGLTGITQIAAGFQRSLALGTGGTVWTWGYQSEDPKNPGIVFYTEPVQVEGLAQVVAIAAGSGHAVAVVKGGTVHTWGNNASGELGDGTTTYSAVPVEIRGLSNVVAVSASHSHTLALLADGTVQAWGSNEFGQLGIGSDGDFSTVPVQVGSLTNIVAVVAARTYSMALQSDGTIWAWGAPNAALGLASTTNTTSPQHVVSGLLDQNANSMDDRWELQYFGNLDQTAEGDYDGDGISNLEEFQNSHTNPASGDSDGDFVLDGEEIAAGSDPNDNTSYPPRLRDASRYLRMTSYFFYVHIEYWLETSWGYHPGSEEDIAPHPFLTDLGPILAARVALPTDVERSYGDAMVAATSYANSSLLLQHRRLWLHRFPATGVEARRKVLVLRVRTLGNTADPALARIETLVIPAGQTTSNAIDSATDFSQTQPVATQWEPEYIAEVIVPMDIVSVSFYGDKYWELEKDDGTAVYEAPHWVDLDHNSDATNTAIGERNSPVAFTRNTKPKISAAFKTPGLTAGTPIKIRAHGSDGIEIPATAAHVEGDYTSIPLTESTTPFPDTIKYYNNGDSTAFTLTWEMSIDGGSTWIELGVTKHTVYLTLADPQTDMRYETVASIGCRNADGMETESDLVERVWRDFEDLRVSRVGTTSAMMYWGSWASEVDCDEQTPSCTSAAGLLKNGDGRCGAWMRFLDAALRFQGIEGCKQLKITTKDIPYKGETLTGDGFYVKNWDVSDLPPVALLGVPAQGENNDDPHSAFDDHALVEYAGQLYDPSYGHRYSNLSQWEDASLDFLWYRDTGNTRQGALNSLGDEQTQKEVIDP